MFCLPDFHEFFCKLRWAVRSHVFSGTSSCGVVQESSLPGRHACRRASDASQSSGEGRHGTNLCSLGMSLCYAFFFVTYQSLYFHLIERTNPVQDLILFWAIAQMGFSFPMHRCISWSEQRLLASKNRKKRKRRNCSQDDLNHS